MDFQIRKMTMDDIDNVSKIFLAAQGPEGNGEPWTLETSRGYVVKHFGEFSIVAEINKGIVGFCLAEKEPIEKDVELLIQMMAVGPDIQKNEIGTKLWKFVTKEAQESGLSGARLLAKVGHYSHKWYKELGLVETGYVEMSMNFTKKER